MKTLYSKIPPKTESLSIVKRLFNKALWELLLTHAVCCVDESVNLNHCLYVLSAQVDVIRWIIYRASWDEVDRFCTLDNIINITKY